MSQSKQPKRADGHILMNRLAVVLKEERITNRAIAAQLGYEETTVSKWCTNAIQPPVSTFLRIALLINRDLKDFFVSSREIEDADKKVYLKALAEMARKSKKIGKDKK